MPEEIKDIFDGEYLTIWEDDTFIFIAFPYATINILKEEWNDFLRDVRKIGKLKK